MTPFIVAEVAKTYVNGIPVGTPEPICTLFERILEVNRQKGYRLHDFDLHRLYRKVMVQTPGRKTPRLREQDELQETIIAVFVLDPSFVPTTVVESKA